MKHHYFEENYIRNAIEDCLPEVSDMPSLHFDIMCEIKGEIKVKKRLSLGLVLAIALILITVTAFAASLLWENYAAEVKTIEHEQGDYQKWPLEEKISLAQNLVDMGHIQESEKTTKLFDDATPEGDKQMIVDDLMLELTDMDDVSEINFDMITYAIMGFFETWTPEQRVWWQGITDMYRISDSVDTLVTPTAEDRDMTQKQLADYLQIHQTTYSDYELGNLNIPIPMMEKLADLYQTSIDYLIGRTNCIEPYPHSDGKR